MENLFRKLENNRPFLKMAFEGFAGDGKTFTATQVAIGIHKMINSQKPIALFDTEKAFKALKPQFDAAGIEAIVNDEQRSLSALNQAIKWCESGGADILIIDSITHVWEEFLRAYLNRPDKNGNPLKRNRLEFQDWGVLKPQWKEQFSTPFVLAKCHIIFTGRAGYEYSDERNEETNKREIYKSGIKMKAETETAFEPDILVLMQKQQDLLTDKKSVWREATVIKDRTTQIDGKTFKNPTFENFYPAVKVLLDGAIREIHGANIPDTFEEFESRFGEQKKIRERVYGELQGCFDLMGLGTGANDKQIKAWILNTVWGFNSFEGLEKVNTGKLQSGLNVVKEYANLYKTYLSECLDNETAINKERLGQMLKDLLSPAKAA